MWESITLTVLHVRLAADDGCELPPFKGSTLRGAFGHALRREGCQSSDAPCVHCVAPDGCPSGALFDVAQLDPTERGDRPVPYVLKPDADERRCFVRDQTMEFRLVVLGHARRWLPWIIPALARMGEHGFGAARDRWHLAGIEVEAPVGRRQAVNVGQGLHGCLLPHLTGADLVRAAAPTGPPPSRLALRFHTPTHLRERKQLVSEPSGRVLIKRLLRRVGDLARLYEGLNLDEVNFDDLNCDAERIVSRKAEVRLVDNLHRYSNRQGVSHPLEGFVGSIVLENVPPSLWPYLVLGQWLHVGKGSTYGQGHYTIEPLPEPQRVKARVSAEVTQRRVRDRR